MTFTQQICHPRRVVLVHLAAMGFYKKLLGGGLSHGWFTVADFKRVESIACFVGTAEYLTGIRG